MKIYGHELSKACDFVKKAHGILKRKPFVSKLRGKLFDTMRSLSPRCSDGKEGHSRTNSLRFSLVQLIKKFLPVFLIFLSAAVLRFAISPIEFHVDMFSNAGWGEWIHKNGPMGFYENSIWVYSWPTQPPLVSLLYGLTSSLYFWTLELLRQSANIIVKYHLAPGHMVWWFNFVIWFDNPLSSEIWFPYGFLISIKSIAIMADIVIAGIIFWLAKKLERNPVIWSAIYLFSPFTWYLSALWGQYDQVAYLFTLSSFMLLIKMPGLSPLLMAISISLKPTTVIFAPLYLWMYLKRKPQVKTIFFGVITSILFTYFTLLVFTSDNLIVFIKEVLIPKIILKSEFRVSTNAYNFWHILTLGKALGHNTRFLFLPAKTWGLMAFALINIKTFMYVKKLNYKNIFISMFVIGAGSWLFMTNMLERYFFAGVVGGLFVTMYQPRLFKYWIIMSLIFWVNLFKGWWFPESFSFLKNAMTVNNGIAGLFLSLANVSVYIIMTRNIFQKEKRN
jgi:hypothetical protein